MEKTAKEWFAHLPEPIRSQAVENWERHPVPNEKELLHSSLRFAVHSFIWHETPQGFDYWDVIDDRIKSGEFDQPEPNLHGWIAVADRLPTAEDGDENGNVLIVDRHGVKVICTPESARVNMGIVKYWQPLPKLPEVKGGGDGR